MLAAVGVVKKLRVIIDWHNYGYTIMEANNVNRLLVRLAKTYEKWFSAIGDEHLTVSEAFRNDLVATMGVPSERLSVLYDKAVSGKFKKMSLEQKHNFYYSVCLDGMFTVPGKGDEIEYRDDRPLLLITSTSYTPDEDLDLLLKALADYVKHS